MIKEVTLLTIFQLTFFPRAGYPYLWTFHFFWIGISLNQFWSNQEFNCMKGVMLWFVSLLMKYFSFPLLSYSCSLWYVFLQLDSLLASLWFIEHFPYLVVTPHAVPVLYYQKGIICVHILDYAFPFIFGQPSPNQFYCISYICVPTYSSHSYLF